jgi:hypothetical protein
MPLSTIFQLYCGERKDEEMSIAIPWLLLNTSTEVAGLNTDSCDAQHSHILILFEPAELNNKKKK